MGNVPKDLEPTTLTLNSRIYIIVCTDPPYTCTNTKEGRSARAKEDGVPQFEEYCYFNIIF